MRPITRLLCGWLLAAAVCALPAAAQAALLGLNLGEPTIDTPGDGIISYKAATAAVSISGSPATIVRANPFLFGEFVATGANDERVVQFKFTVGADGAVTSSGTATEPGFKLVAAVDVDFDGVADYEGTLLEGTVTAFGFQDGGAADDIFEVKVTLSGGTMRALYPTDRLNVSITSENSTEFPTPFAGSFAVDFSGAAKMVIGAGEAPPPPADNCKIKVDAYCSVNGGPFSSKCRIAQYKSPKFWDWEERVCHGKTVKRYTYGLHDTPEPQWSRARGHEATNVTFKYVIRNAGTTPVTDLYVDDSFDTPVNGVPAGLAVGQSVTLMRTESLRESIDNIVFAQGKNGGSLSCQARDTVVVREKLRDRRRHDDDRYRDKGRRHDDD